MKWICGGPGAGFIWVRPDTVAALALAIALTRGIAVDERGGRLRISPHMFNGAADVERVLAVWG